VLITNILAGNKLGIADDSWGCVTIADFFMGTFAGSTAISGSALKTPVLVLIVKFSL
jgi:carbohydrate-binding DOMON domain-containing protein